MMSDVDYIFKAVADNDLQRVNAMLSANPKLADAVDTRKDSWTNDFDFPLLYMASIFGHMEIARHLIECGAEVNARTRQGLSALDAAIQFGYYNIASMLIENGADINGRNGWGMTPLHVAADFYHDVPIGHFIETLLAKGADIEAKDDDGRTAYDIAASSGDREIAGILLKHGASITNIHSAVAAGNIEKVRTMLKESPGLVHEGNRATHTVESLLQNASYWGHKDILLQLLESGADALAQDGHYENALFRVASKEIAEILIERGIDACTRNISGATPLHYARSLGIAKILVQYGADVNAADNTGYTPLHYGPSRDVAEFLVRQGADPNAMNDEREIPIHHASSREAAEFFVQQGADINAKSTSGWTPLDMALNEKKDDVASYLLSLGAVVNRRSNAHKGSVN
jgi:ankyrin repeat protein